MIVELVQTRRVPFDKAFPEAGSFPLRGGVTLIVAAPDRDASGPPCAAEGALCHRQAD